MTHPSMPQPGQQFEGRYRLDRIVGSGGFATVFGATDVASGRVVALKVLEPEGQTYDPQTRARYEREITLQSQLRDPHTVTLFDFGESTTGLLYMVFEYVPGVDLSELLEQARTLRPADAVHVLRQLLHALMEAHAAGLLHRDLKPENVRVFEYQGDPLTVKLLDFGIARPTRPQGPAITATGELIGTPRYMPPEQLTERELSPASDIYSLGILAYEMLLGRDALQGNRWSDQIDRLRSGHVFGVPTLAQVDPRLIAIVQRMTARKPENRYQSAAAVLHALDRLDAARSPSRDSIERRASPPQTRSRTQPEVEKSRGGMLIGIAVALLLTAGFVAWWTSRPADDPPRKTIPPALLSAAAHGERNLGNLVVRDLGPTADRADTGSTDDMGEQLCAPPPFTGRSGYFPPHASRDDGWLTHIPAGYDSHRRYPLVVLLHQTAEEPSVLLRGTRFGALADTEGFIVVAPRDPNIFYPWTNPEVARARVHLAVETISNELCVDRSRVFVVGHGQGGRLATTLRCEPWVTAVATNSFRENKNEPFCETKHPRPFLMLSPLRSSREPVDGGTACGVHPGEEELASLAESEEIWRKRHHCSGPRKQVLEERDGTCFTWDCTTPFESCHLNGGHPWPGMEPRALPLMSDCDGTAPRFPTTRVVWEFFRDAPPLKLADSAPHDHD